MFYFLYLREREREHEQGRGREMETESEAGSKLRAVNTEPDAGPKLINGEIMTWAEVERLTDWDTEAPRDFVLFLCKTESENIICFFR